MTVADPLRIWVIGDSLAGPLGFALSSQVRGFGLAEVQVDHVGGSGLTSPGYLDWPRMISDTMPGVTPDAVVIHIGANDARGMSTPDGWADVGDDAWSAHYATLVGGVMDQLLRGADRVFWVGAPVMGGEFFSDRIRTINSVFVSEAEIRPGVIYVDAYEVFADEAGGYSRYVPGADSTPIDARAGDGIHYTSAGAALLADVVRPLVLFEWRVWPAADD